MAHDIFGERFLSLRQPAWHGIGTVSETPMTAREALTHIGGDLNYALFPNCCMVEGELVDLPSRTICRYPTPDDPQFAVLGNVGPEYTLLTPREVCDIWDQAVAQPVETMGVLRRGGLFFCTSKLPTIDVRGDEVEMYLGLSSPMDGERSASTEIWPLRVVCQNTLRVAQARAKASFRIVHDSGAKQRLAAWLHDAYRQAEQNHFVVKQAFELLAEKSVPESTALSIIRRTYPEPRLPRRDAPDGTMEIRMERFKRAQIRIHHRREQALALFEGDGTGMDTVAARGTAWGIYSAITETENYRKGFARGGLEAEAARVGEDLLFGRRGETMERAFNACLAVAGGGADFDPSLN